MNTEKKLQDYLHLYIGGEILLTSMGEEVICRIINVTASGSAFASGPLKNGQTLNSHGKQERAKLLLRPLSDITEEEKAEFIEICGIEPEDIACLVRSRDEFFPEPETSFGAAHLTNIAQWAVGVTYLLSKNFDLFQLIEFGLAIDQSTLKTPQQ